MGHDDGSIIAIIIACHINRNIHAEAAADCPGIPIHIIGMVHPPGMGIPPAIRNDARTVMTAAATKTKAAISRAWRSSLPTGVASRTPAAGADLSCVSVRMVE